MKRQSTSQPLNPKAIKKQWNQVRRDVISHELGHWLVARSVGIATGDITVTINQHNQMSMPYQNGDSWLYPAPVVTTVEELKTYLEDRMCILYGGLAGQTHGLGLDPVALGEILERDAATDLRLIKELVPILRGMQFGPEVDQKTSSEQCNEVLEPIWERTKTLVEGVYPKLTWMRDQLETEVIQSNKTYRFAYDRLLSLAHQYPG